MCHGMAFGAGGGGPASVVDLVSSFRAKKCARAWNNAYGLVFIV